MRDKLNRQDGGVRDLRRRWWLGQNVRNLRECRKNKVGRVLARRDFNVNLVVRPFPFVVLTKALA